MTTRLFTATALLALMGSAALAAPAKKAPAKKLTEVRVCPIAGEAVIGGGSGNQKEGNYRVYFCCEGCQPEFNKLSKADRQKKIAVALKKQAAKKKA